LSHFSVIYYYNCSYI